MATFGDLISEVEEKIDQTLLGTSPTVTTSPAAKAINRAIKYFEPERFWFNEASTSITLTSGDPVVPSLPSDFQFEVSNGGLAINYSSTRYPIKKISVGDYDRINHQGSGLPYAYKQFGGQIDLYFYPDQAYTLELRYIKKYTDMTSVSDTNDWTNNAERLIVAKALEDLYLDRRHSNASGLYGLYAQKRQDEFQQLMDKTNQRSTTGSLQTEDVFNDGARFAYPYFY